MSETNDWAVAMMDKHYEDNKAEEEAVKQDFVELRHQVHGKVMDKIAVVLDSQRHYVERARFNNVYDKSSEDVIADLERYMGLFAALSRHMPLGYVTACGHYLEELIERYNFPSELHDEYIIAHWGE